MCMEWMTVLQEKEREVRCLQVLHRAVNRLRNRDKVMCVCVCVCVCVCGCVCVCVWCASVWWSTGWSTPARPTLAGRANLVCIGVVEHGLAHTCKAHTCRACQSSAGSGTKPTPVRCANRAHTYRACRQDVVMGSIGVRWSTHRIAPPPRVAPSHFCVGLVSCVELAISILPGWCCATLPTHSPHA